MISLETEYIAFTTEPDWVLARPFPPPSSACVLLLEKQVHCGNKAAFHRCIKQYPTLNTIQENSIIELDINPSSERLSIHSVILHRNGSAIDKMAEVKTRLVQKEEQSQKFIYTGDFTFILILDDMRVGDIVEYSYSYQSIDPWQCSFNQYKLFFETEEEVGSLFLRLIAPSSIRLKYHGNFYSPAIHSLEGDDQEWAWELQDVKKGKLEQEQPSWYFPCDWLQVSSFESWGAASKQAESIFSTEYILDPSIRKQVAQWRNEFQNLEDLVVHIIRFVQNQIRYLSLDDERLNPHYARDPNQVFFKRFGDCKDKCALMRLLLTEIGVNSYPALVNTRLKDKTASLLPSLLFNHAILAIEWQGQFCWVDPTLTYQGGTLINFTPIDYGYGLLIGKPGHSLALIERKGSVSKSHTVVTFNVKQQTMGVKTNLYGWEAEKMRAHLDANSKEELTKRYVNFYNAFYPGIKSIHTIEIIDLLNENLVTINEDYFIPELADTQTEKGCAIYHLKPHSILAKVIVPSLERCSPQAIEYPLDIREDIIIESDRKVNFKSHAKALQNGCFEFSENLVKQSETNFCMIYCLKSLKDHMVPSEGAEVQSLMEEVSNASFTLTLKNFRMDRLLLCIGFFIIFLQMIRLVG